MKALATGSLALFLLLSSGFAQADCSALFNDLHNYAQTPSIGNCQPNFNTIYVKMATNRSDNRYVSYAEGFTTEKTVEERRFPLFPSFGGTLNQTFSDRIKGVYETRCDVGAFCLPLRQNFVSSAADQLGANFYNNSVILTLKSWGNGRTSIPLTCTPSGIMYGEKDGTFFTFSFQKTIYENTCIK